MEEKIEKNTPQQQLDLFYNGHLKSYLACLIRLKVCTMAAPKDVVGARQIPPMAPGQPPGAVDVTAKEMAVQEERNIDLQGKFLRAVEKVEEDLKKNEKPWQLR